MAAVAALTAHSAAAWTRTTALSSSSARPQVARRSHATATPAPARRGRAPPIDALDEVRVDLDANALLALAGSTLHNVVGVHDLERASRLYHYLATAAEGTERETPSSDEIEFLERLADASASERALNTLRGGAGDVAKARRGAWPPH